MNRKYIWLISCISALVISFLSPWIVLRIMERNEKNEIIRLDDMGQLQDYGSLSVAQKQIILSSGRLTISDDRSISKQERETVEIAFRKELDQLFDCGAIANCIPSAFSEEISIQAKLALLAEDGRAFRYCEISNASGTATAIYDAERQLILRISLRGQSDQYRIDLGASSDEDFKALITEELRSWANYFGCSAQDINAISQEDYPADRIGLVEYFLSDGSDSFRFGLIYNIDQDLLCWGYPMNSAVISPMESLE